MSGVEDRLEPEVQVNGDEPQTRLTAEDQRTDFLEEFVPDLPSLPEHVQQLIDRVMDGTEPYARPLHHYEVKKFTARHVLICIIRTAGFQAKEIARMTGYTRFTIGAVLNHPYGKQLVRSLMGANGPRVIDIRTRLEEHALELMDHTFNLAMLSEEVEDVAKVTFGFLDRAGYATKQQVEANVNMRHSMETTRSEPSLARLAAAMEQSNRVSQEIMPNWTPAKPPDLGGGGSIGTPDPFLESGPGVDAPPGTSPQKAD